LFRVHSSYYGIYGNAIHFDPAFEEDLLVVELVPFLHRVTKPGQLIEIHEEPQDRSAIHSTRVCPTCVFLRDRYLHATPRLALKKKRGGEQFDLLL
jgi:hypothetical protein